MTDTSQPAEYCAAKYLASGATCGRTREEHGLTATPLLAHPFQPAERTTSEIAEEGFWTVRHGAGQEGE